MSDISVPHLSWRVVLNRAAPPDVRGWGRVRAAQLREMSRTLKIVSWAQAFNAVIFILLLHDTAPVSRWGFWTLGVLFLVGLTHRQDHLLKRKQFRYLPKQVIDKAGYHSVLFAMVWAFPARYLTEFASSGEQLAICFMTVAMMTGAAFIFASIPFAAAGYVLIMGVSLTHMLAGSGSLVTLAIGPVYTAVLLAFVIANGRQFMIRTWLDLALEDRRETVSLLLKEYEESDAGWLWQTNSRLTFQNVSPRFARATGRSVEELEGMTLLDLIGSVSEITPALRRTIAKAEETLKRREPFLELVVPIQVGDKVHSFELSAKPRRSRQGQFQGYRGVGSDVTAARQAADRIAHMARHDALTGLPNRLQLLEGLDIALEGARANGTRCALLLVDLDRFKSINDSLGHIAGDHLLQQVAGAFETVISDDMIAGRLGGDEFAIMVPHAESAAGLEQLAMALMGTLQGPFYYRDQRLLVGASIGIAIGPDDGITSAELMRNADLALYRAKEAKGDEISFYDHSLHARAEERRRIELALHGAVDGGEFSLAYQPVVNTSTGRIESFEALLRWLHPEMGPISPGVFIPIAEETGMLGRIGEWVLRTACIEAARWPSDISIAVNVSPKQIHDPGFLVTLMSALSRAGLEPHRLELEVTETVFLELTADTQKILKQIQSLGVRLAMDDFGTGYSSLGYLRRADFDTLKIDRSFVQALDESDRDSTAIIRAIVALAGSLNMKTVAEGVATEEQLRLVRALGCDKIQGFIYSHPVPAAQARDLMGTRQIAAA